MKSLIKRLMIFFMWYPLRAAIRFLPLGFTYWLGVAGGNVLCLISGAKARAMAEELGAVMKGAGPAEVGRTVRASFVNYCLSELEVLLYPSLDEAYIRRFVRIEGREHLDAALARGKGVLLFQAHFGAFQMVMPAVGYSGYTMNQISASASVWKDDAAPGVHKKMFDMKAECEYSLPVKHISITSSLRPLFNALKRGEIVGITVDGGGGKRVAGIRFLGRDALIQTGAVEIAASTGAEMVPAFITTEKGLRHTLRFHRALRPEHGLGRDEAAGRLLGEFAALLESYVHARPDHYGYTLGLRRLRAPMDEYPFFEDYGGKRDYKFKRKAAENA